MQEQLFSRTVSGAGTYYGESRDMPPGGFVASAKASSVTGTNPTVDVTIEDSPTGRNVPDASADWFTAATLTQLTTNAKAGTTFSGAHFKRIRAKVVIGGTSTPGALVEVVYSSEFGEK